MEEKPGGKRRNTRQALIEAGIAEINRYGVTEFSVRRIAATCGVSCGAPYKHFGDRKEFIAAVIDYVNEQWHRQQAKILADYEGDTKAQVVEMSTGYVKFLVENPNYRTILTMNDAEFNNVYHRIRGEAASPTQKLIERYCREFHLTPEERLRKVYVFRALIFGAAIQFDNGELEYNDHTLQVVHDSIKRETELP